MIINPDFLQKYPDQQNQIPFQFCYLQNDPQSLTVTFHPEKIFNMIYQLPKFIWLNSNHQNMESIIADFKTDVEQQLTCIVSIEAVADYIQISPSQQTIFLICREQIVEEVVFKLQIEFKRQKIRKLIYIGEGDGQWLLNISPYFEKNIQSVKNESQVISEILKFKNYYTEKKELSNFISLSTQIDQSNILVNTIFAMINQKTNRKQLCKQLNQLAKIAFPGLQQKIHCVIQRMQERPLDTREAIELYTSESFLYDILNKILRSTKQPASIYIVQPYFRDLFNGIRNLYLQQKKQSNKKQKIMFFRGGLISEKEFKFFESNINSIIQNLGFMSTSKSEEVSYKFISNVIFQIEAEYSEGSSQLDFGFAYVEEYSVSKGQYEVIFNPLNTFKIQKVVIDENIFKISLKHIIIDSILKQSSENLSEYQKKLQILSQYQIQSKKSFTNMSRVLTVNFLKGSIQYSQMFIKIALKRRDNDLFLTGLMLIAKYRSKKEIRQFLIKYYEIFVSQEISQSDVSFVNLLLTHITQICAEFYQYDDALKYINLMTKEYQQQDFILNRLALIYMNKGDLEKAKLIAIKAISKISQKYGNKHPSYAYSLNKIVTIQVYLNNLEKALQIQIQAKDIIKNTYGESNRQYVYFLRNVGMCYQAQYNYKKALQTYMDALAIIKKKSQYCQQNQLLYYQILSFIGDVYLQLYEFDKAKEYCQKAIELLVRKYGKNNSQYIFCLQRRGNIYFTQKKFSQSLACYLECLNIMKNRIFQEKWIYNAKVFHQIGNSYFMLGQYQEAYLYFVKSKKLIEQLLNGKHFFYPEVLKSIGNVYSVIHQIDKALELYLIASQIQKNTIGQNNLRFTDSLTRISLIYRKKNCLNKSLEYGTVALKIIEKIAKKSIQYCDSLKSLGNTYQYFGQIKKALELYQQAKQICQKLLGDHHIDYAVILTNIGDIKKQQGQFTDALQYYFQARDIYNQKNLQYKLVSVYMQIGETFNKLGQHNKAQYYFITAKNIQRKNRGQNNICYASILLQIGKLFIILNQYQKALPYLEGSYKIYINLKINNGAQIKRIQQRVVDLKQKIGKERKFISEEDIQLIKKFRQAYQRIQISSQLYQGSSFSHFYFNETIDQILTENALCTNFLNL